jgi:hypothetical protein
MAREDTHWFIVAVIVLSLVLFFALPMSLLIYVDTQTRLKMAEVRIEKKLKKIEELERSLKETQKEKVPPND